MTTILPTTTPKNALSFKKPAGQRSAGFSAVLKQQLAGTKADDSRLWQGAKPQLVVIGIITPERPTVSHLLIHDPRYRNQCWSIIHDPINRGKRFRDIDPGQVIAIDPQTREILWGKALAARQEKTNQIQAARESVPEPEIGRTNEADGIPTQNNVKNLSTVLEAYIGTPYKKMNCFQLLVQGLINLGIRYGGDHGLQYRLIRKAEQARLPENAYLTGEGITNALSTLIYQNTFHVKRPQQEARQLFSQLEPRLAPGMILSFSTTHHGHTGVISRYEGRWTFLNSGFQDHPVGVSTTREGVGQEDLLGELTDWFKLAKMQKQPLLVTIGKLASGKIASYLPETQNEAVLRASL